MSGLWLILVIAAWAVVFGGLLGLRLRDQRRRDGFRQVVRLHFPRDLTSDGVLRFVRSLVAMGGRRAPFEGRPSVSFEIWASGRQELDFLLRVPAGFAREVLTQLRSAVPDVVVEALDRPPDYAPAQAVELALTDDRRPLRADHPEAVAAAVLAALAARRPQESLVVQWVLGATPPMPPEARPRQRPAQKPAAVDTVLRRAEEERLSAREWREKTAEPLLGASLRIGATADTPERTRSLLRRVQGVLDIVSRPGVRFRARRLPTVLVRRRLIKASTPVNGWPLRLSAAEAAVVLAWPVGTPTVPGLPAARRRLLTAADSVPAHGRILGDSALPGVSRPLAMSAAASLRHLHVLAPTGTGKTTLLAGLAVQDLEAGRGVVVIDPKGDLARAVLDRVPAARQSDVIVLDPVDDERPCGLNLLEDAQLAPERTADLVVGLLHRLFASSWGPRTADILYAAMLTLSSVPHMTLVELPVLLTNDAFRRRLVGQLHDPVALEPFWAWYEALTPGERANVIGPVMNKLRAFLLRRRLRLVLAQSQPTWRFDDVLNRGKILIVPLDEGELGPEAASLVGALVVARLWQAVQRRTIRTPVMIFIDEVQRVVHLPTDLADVLARCRSYGVGLHLAHQHLGQLDARMRAAVLDSARSRVVFQVGADDAGVLARSLGGGLTPADLMNLPAFEAYASLLAGDAVTPPASLKTRPLGPATGSAATVRAASRQRYGQDAAAIEAAIAARHGQAGDQSDPGLGRRRRAS